MIQTVPFLCHQSESRRNVAKSTCKRFRSRVPRGGQATWVAAGADSTLLSSHTFSRRRRRSHTTWRAMHPRDSDTELRSRAYASPIINPASTQPPLLGHPLIRGRKRIRLASRRVAPENSPPTRAALPLMRSLTPEPVTSRTSAPAAATEAEQRQT